MVTCEWLEEEIRGVIPDCDVEAIDLNGTQDHFHIRVISESFEGMRPLQRQKIIPVSYTHLTLPTITGV